MSHTRNASYAYENHTQPHEHTQDSGADEPKNRSQRQGQKNPDDLALELELSLGSMGMGLAAAALGQAGSSGPSAGGDKLSLNELAAAAREARVKVTHARMHFMT